MSRMPAGDVVLRPKHTGSEVGVGGEEHLILEATDLPAMVRTAAVAA